MKVSEVVAKPQGSDNNSVHTIFYGPVEAMMAEVGAADPREQNKNHKWAVMPAGDEPWDTHGCYNLAHALEIARELADFFGVKHSRVKIPV